MSSVLSSRGTDLATRDRLELLRGLVLVREERPTRLGLREQRLLALLALEAAPRLRGYLAGLLWPETPQRRAGGNLRESLSRLQRAAPGVVVADDGMLALAPGVDVDLWSVRDLIHRLDRDGSVDDPLAALDTLAGAELLPGWYDDWVTGERDRLQQARLRALETLASSLQHRRPAVALQAALVAVDVDPLRDAALRLALRLHVQQGNEVEAIRLFTRYRRHLRSELGIEPPRATSELVGALTLRAVGHMPIVRTSSTLRVPAAGPGSRGVDDVRVTSAVAQSGVVGQPVRPQQRSGSMPAKGNSIKQVSDVLTQLHDSGVINLDKSVRDMLAPAAALAELQPGSQVATSVVAWDGYGVVIKGSLNNPAELGNVAGQLRQAAGGGV